MKKVTLYFGENPVSDLDLVIIFGIIMFIILIFVVGYILGLEYGYDIAESTYMRVYDVPQYVSNWTKAMSGVDYGFRFVI